MKIKINDYSHEGRGIGKINNKVIFVPFSMPREEVEVSIQKETKNYIDGKLEKIIKKNKNRQTPKCPYYYECGGCNIMHMSYQEQLSFKVNKIKNILKKYCDIDINPTIVKSNSEFNYRNKVTLHSKNKKHGFFKNNSNEIIEIEKCLIASKGINEEIKKVKLSNEDVIIRENSQNEIISSNTEKQSFIENINGYKYKVNINSFFQVNNYICEKLVSYVTSLVENEKIIFDLYCGVGTFTIPLSEKCNEIYGIEYNKEATRNAEENKILNNRKNIKFMTGKVENEIFKIKEKPDLIVMDPARSGLNEKVIDFINEKKIRKLIYISCEPLTLAKDIKKLKDSYELKSIKLFDMFPNTHHVECVILLQKKN